jgi:hypothetical protein
VADEHQEAHIKIMSITQFSVGDYVVIRYGKHQGEKAKIMKSVRADDYKVKTELGFVLFYSGKGLSRHDLAVAKPPIPFREQ